jgi:hypothetical protein
LNAKYYSCKILSISNKALSLIFRDWWWIVLRQNRPLFSLTKSHHSGPGSTLIRPIYEQKFRWHDIGGSSLGNILSLMVHAAESPTDGRCGVDVFTRPAADLLALIQ